MRSAAISIFPAWPSVQPTKSSPSWPHPLNLSGRPATTPHLIDRTPRLSKAQLHAFGRFSSGLSTTVATSLRHESFELADFNSTTRPLAAEASRSSSACEQQSRVASRPFEPAANSQSLAGLRYSQTENWEKISSQHPHGPRSRLRFWVEALRRRAHLAGLGQVDNESEKSTKMKFSHSIQFNAVPDWSSNYIAYSNLKKLWVVFSHSF